jgi:hypothetical protein
MLAQIFYMNCWTFGNSHPAIEERFASDSIHQFSIETLQVCDIALNNFS